MTEVHRSFSCTVVRRVGAPLTYVLVKAQVLGSKGLSVFPSGHRGRFRVLRSRDRRLLSLAGGILALSGLRGTRLEL